MSNMNNIHMVGNLTADPELRYTTTGRPVCNFRIGVNERFTVDREWQTRSTFIGVVVWGSLAENVAMSTQKGNRVAVSGRLNTRSYEVEGGTRYVTELVADDVAVSLRFAAVEGIIPNEAPATQAPVAPNGAPIYGDDEPF